MGDNNRQDENDTDLMKDMPDMKLEDLQQKLSDEDKDESTG